LVRADQRRLNVNDPDIVGYLLNPVADREPAAQLTCRDLAVQPRPSDLVRLLASDRLHTSVRRIRGASWRYPATAVIVARSTSGTGRKPYHRCLAQAAGTVGVD